MRIGIHLEFTTDPRTLVAGAAALRNTDSVWMNSLPGGWDPLAVLGGLGPAGPAEVGTAIVPTYPTHPAALAASALVVQELTGGRLVLGVGPSHEAIVTGRLGIPYASPAAHTREYLEVLRPLLHGEHVRHSGRFLTVDAGWAPDLGITAPPPPLLLAATGPKMLEVARDLADGIVATWVRPDLVDGWLRPRIAPDARVVVAVPVAITDDPDGARADLAERFAAASELPAYRSLMDRAGLAGPADTLVAGPEREVLAELRRYADAGVTDLVLVPQGSARERERVLDVAAGARVG